MSMLKKSRKFPSVNNEHDFNVSESSEKTVSDRIDEGEALQEPKAGNEADKRL